MTCIDNSVADRCPKWESSFAACEHPGMSEDGRTDIRIFMWSGAVGCLGLLSVEWKTWVRSEYEGRGIC